MMPLWLLLGIVLPRIGLSVLGFIDPQRFVRPDSLNYLQLASNLWRHGAFSDSVSAPFFPEAFRVPGFPLFLGIWTSVLNLPLSWSVTAQCVLSVTTLFLIWTWLRSFTSVRRATWATFAMAIDPVLFFHTPLILAETLFLLMVTAATISTWRTLNHPNARQWGFCGLLWGLASFVRPVSLFLPIFISVLCIRKKKALAAFLLGAYLLPCLWCARNYQAAGTFSFTTQGGIDLMKYSAPAIVSMDSGRTLQEASDYLKGPIDAAHAPYASPFEQSRLYGQRAAQVIVSHPFLFARFCAYGATRILFGSAFEMFFEITGIPSDVPYPAYHSQVGGQSTRRLLSLHRWMIPFFAAYMLALLALYIGWGLGVRRLFKMNRLLEGRFLLVGALYFLVLSSPLGHYRFRIPMLPFLIAGAVFALPEKRQ